MRRKVLTFAAIGILAALSFGSPLDATPAAKKPIKIDSRTRGIDAGTGKFVLQLGKTGGDLGTVTFTRSFRPKGEHGTIAPDGQDYFIAMESDTLKGRNGTLVIRAVGPAYTLGGSFGNYENWTGTWSIVSGTGDCSGMTGAADFGIRLFRPRFPGHQDFDGLRAALDPELVPDSGPTAPTCSTGWVALACACVREGGSAVSGAPRTLCTLPTRNGASSTAET